MTTGPQAVLCIDYQALAEDGTQSAAERMIPFVAAYVDAVDVPGKRITVDWQPDY
jgi:16S rRNA processing protein RimM